MKIFLMFLLLVFASKSFAETVTIFTTTGPGSLSDQAARYIQPIFAKELGVNVVVVNSPGANGVVGLREFNNTPGNNILIGSFAVPYVAKVTPQKDFNPVKDFVPIVGLTHTPMHILVPVNSIAKGIAGLVTLSKSNNGLKGGSSHPSNNISMFLFDSVAGTSTDIISYKQGAQLYADLAAGRIDYTFGGNSIATSMIQSGHLRSLGRLDQLGVPDFSWTALFVKAGNENGKVAETARRVINQETMRGLSHPFFNADSEALRRLILQEYALIPVQ